MISKADINYGSSWDEQNQLSSQTCTAKRFRSTRSNYLEIKYGTPYMVKTGYMVYTENKERPIEAATGIEIEFIWDSATTLAAIGAALVSTLFF